MGPDERDAVLARLARLTREHPDLRSHQTFTMPLVTIAIRATLA